jgi:hypothetical protein
MKFDFAPEAFDPTGRMYIAAFGSVPPTSIEGKPAAGSILCLDLETGKLEAFARNRSGQVAGDSLNGLNHPVDVSFGPDGCLYVVDFGVIEPNGRRRGRCRGPASSGRYASKGRSSGCTPRRATNR